jgi:glycerate dehydrogenase
MAYTSKSTEDLPPYILKKTLDELLGESDVLSLHCPLTPDTQHLINRQTLQKLKPSAILINTGRGPLVDDQAVADALQADRLRAFCADVLTEEPPKAENPLLKCENAYITPHIAWASCEARTRLIDIAINNVRAFVNGNPQNVVSN